MRRVVRMESTEVFILVLLIAAVSTQKKNLPPSDTGSANSGGLMSKLFTWANSVRPIQPPGQNIPSSNVGFPPDSLGPDAGFPPDSLGQDTGFPPDSLNPGLGLPPDSLGPGAGSSDLNFLLSGGVLSMSPSNTEQLPEQSIPVEKLPLNQKLPGSASSDKGSLLSGGMLSLPPSDTMQPPQLNMPVEKLPLNQKLPDQGLPAAGQNIRNKVSSSVDILSGGVLSFPMDNNDPNSPGMGFSNQLPPSVDIPLVDDKRKMQNKPAVTNLDLPSNPSIQDLNKGVAFPDQPLPSLGNQNSGMIPVQNTGNVKPDIIDSNVLFPVAEVLPSAKDTQNNDFLMNFFPTFPTGEEIVNLNNGGFVQELGQSGFPPAQDILPGGSTGMLPGKPDRLPVESFKPKQTFPSDMPVKPDIHKPILNKMNKQDTHKPTMDKTKQLPVLEPIPMDQFQPADLGKAPINQFNPAQSGMVSVDQFTPMGSEKIRQTPFKDPHDKIVPVDHNRFSGPFSSGDPGRVPVDQFIPMDSGRPISVVPIDAMKQEPIPDLHPMKEPALDMMRPGGVVALGKPKPRASQSNEPMATVAQDVLPKKKPEGGDPRADQIMAKWIALYPEGRRPEKMKPVKIEEVHEIAPPTPDQALLSQISLVNYGKDKAMRRMLREQRKQARKRQRRLRKQRQQQRLQQNNVGNQRLPTQGKRNNRNVRNNRNRRQRKRDINPGVVMGMSRGI